MAALLWLLATGVLFVIEMVTANLLFASLAISAGAYGRTVNPHVTHHSQTGRHSVLATLVGAPL